MVANYSSHPRAKKENGNSKIDLKCLFDERNSKQEQLIKRKKLNIKIMLILLFTFCLMRANSQNCNEDFDEIWYTGEQVSTLGNYTGKKILVMNNIVINQSVVIDNCEIVFASGTGLSLDTWHQLQSTSTQSPVYKINLIIKNNSILRGCNNMWKGLDINIGRNFQGTSSWQVSDGYLDISDSKIEDAEIAINCDFNIPEKISNKYSGEVRANIDNVIFLNNFYGIKGNFSGATIKGCTFDFNSFKQTYSGQQNYGSIPHSGILNENGNLSIHFKNYFKNLENGIIYNANDNTKNVSVNNCDFENITNIGIDVSSFKTLNCNSNLMENIENTGIHIRSNNLLSSISSNSNIINDASIGIDINNSNPKFVTVRNNTISQSSNAIKIDNLLYENCTVHINTINNCGFGVKFSGVNSSSGKTALLKLNTINHNAIGIILDKSTHNHLEDNIVYSSISQYNNFKSRLAIWNKNEANNNYFVDNNISTLYLYNFLLEQSSNNNLCCNDIRGSKELLTIRGTNSNTYLGATKLTGLFSGYLELAMNQTAIGTQSHTGNRWKSSSGTNASLSNSVVNQNLFIVNNSETNLTDGRIRPQTIIPSAITNTWFPNDNVGSSSSCSQVSNCGLFVPPTSVDIPDEEEEDLTPEDEPCYPTDIDTDGDGICDSLDPDPDDACNPNSDDTDGDGICDSLDPDPNDSCNPISLDKDGDGICDNSDPAPYDPCIPNGTDSDGDDLCDHLDPDDSDDDIPSHWETIEESEYEVNMDGDINPVFPFYASLDKLTQLNESVNFTFGNSDREIVNDWENKITLMKYLIQNPYYNKVSSTLYSFYTSNSNNEIRAYANTELELNNIKKLKDQDKLEIVTLSSKLDRLITLKKLYSKDTLIDTALVSLIHNKIFTLENQIENIEEDYFSNKNLKIDDLNDIIDNLSSSKNFLPDRKTMWQLLLKKEVEGVKSLLTDVSTLEEIAFKCPLEFGTSVFDAQNVLIELELYIYEDFEENCEPNSRKSNSVIINNSDSDKTVVQPNPSTSTFRLAVQENSKINLKNLSGVVLNNKDIIRFTKNNFIEINLVNYPNGIYFLEIFNQKGEKEIVKLIKIE